VRIFIGKISDTKGRGILISFSLIFYIISMWLLAIANSSTMLLLAAIAEGAGAGILIPTMLALISDRSYVDERGRVYALCLGGFDVGIALAGPILGFLTSYVSYRGVFTINAVLAIMALVVFGLKGNRSFSDSWRFAIGKQKDLYGLDV
ncbi:MAG: MFS transporter, partial [Cyanobacteria bacterium J06642_3]